MTDVAAWRAPRVAWMHGFSRLSSSLPLHWRSAAAHSYLPVGPLVNRLPNQPLGCIVRRYTMPTCPPLYKIDTSPTLYRITIQQQAGDFESKRMTNIRSTQEL